MLGRGTTGYAPVPLQVRPTATSNAARPLPAALRCREMSRDHTYHRFSVAAMNEPERMQRKKRAIAQGWPNFFINQTEKTSCKARWPLTGRVCSASKFTKEILRFSSDGDPSQISNRAYVSPFQRKGKFCRMQFFPESCHGGQEPKRGLLTNILSLGVHARVACVRLQVCGHE